MEDIEIKLNQLVDDELCDSEQIEIFESLAKDHKARQIYSELFKLKKEITKHYSNANTELYSLKINQVVKEQRYVSIFKIGFAFSSAATIILLMLLWWGQTENKIISKQINSLNEKYELMKAERNLLLNKPRIKSTIGELVSSSKNNIVSIKRIQPKNSIILNKNLTVDTITNKIKTYREISLAKSVVINKDDYIGGQIVSN
jgi:hypothetical protein